MKHEIFELPSIKNFAPIDNDRWGLNIPKQSLYHYTASVTAVKNILTTGELWMSKSTVMNDYSEISYGVSMIKQGIEKYAQTNQRFQRLFDNFSKTIENFTSNYFILSFTTNDKSRLLWDSYANKEGYNIEFSPDLISDFAYEKQNRKAILKEDGFTYENYGRKVFIKNNAGEKYLHNGYSYEIMANNVIYDDKQQHDMIDEVMNYIDEKYQRMALYDVQIALNLLIDIIPFFKDPTLRDEEEYRLVVKISPTKNEKDGKKQYLRNVQCYREVKNKLFPYIKLQMNTKQYIKSVALGYLNKDELSVQTFEEFISTLPENIKLYKAEYALRW